jgi:hypothetical protein
MPGLLEMLNQAPDDRWRPRAPADPAALSALEGRLGRALPHEHRALLLASDGGSIMGPREMILLHEVARMDETLDDVEVQTALPDMIVFGENAAGAFYYYDPEGRLGRGAWAVYWNELGALGSATSRFAGSDLADTVARVFGGVLFFDEPELGEQAGA